MRPAPAAGPALPARLAPPAYPGDFPDPFILPAGGGYFAYATNANDAHVQMLPLSAGLQALGPPVEALPRLPGWAAPQPGLTWAPAVLPRPGGWVLYYTTRHRCTGLQAISLAVSAAPGGPFVDCSSAPLLLQPGLGGAIDPSPFVAPDGAAYLLWKNDGNSCGQASRLWIQPLARDGRSLTGAPVELLRTACPWEGPLIEAPAMLHHRGCFYLFYSANAWSGPAYAIGLAAGPTPLGPFTRTQPGPWLSSGGGLLGPGGAEVFSGPDGRPWLAFHAWTAPHTGYPAGRRALRLAPLAFRGGLPALDAAGEPPEACTELPIGVTM
ncbi:MAG: glycoside hydrolase family 43 protein [Chloroflexota bacterium]